MKMISLTQTLDSNIKETDKTAASLEVQHTTQAVAVENLIRLSKNFYFGVEIVIRYCEPLLSLSAFLGKPIAALLSKEWLSLSNESAFDSLCVYVSSAGAKLTLS